MSIATNIKRIRESRGLTQDEFGKIVGVSGKAVSTWELGLKAPRMGTIQKIADRFHVKKSEIIDDDAILNLKPTIDEQLSDVDFALFGEVRELTDADKRDVLQFIKFKKSIQEKREK